MTESAQPELPLPTATERKGPTFTQALLIPIACYVGSIALGFTNSCNALLGIGIIGGEMSLAAFVILMAAATHSRALRRGKQPRVATMSAIAVGVTCGLLVLFPMFATLMLFMASDGCGA